MEKKHDEKTLTQLIDYKNCNYYFFTENGIRLIVPNYTYIRFELLSTIFNYRSI